MRHIYVLWALVLLMGAASIFALIRVQNVQANQNAGLHSVICFSENFIRHDKKLTPQQKQQDESIYNHMLAVAHLGPCA